jgi:hypothetical protein
VIVKVLPSLESWDSMKTRRALEWKACDEKPRSISATSVRHISPGLAITEQSSSTFDILPLKLRRDGDVHVELAVEDNIVGCI